MMDEQMILEFMRDIPANLGGQEVRMQMMRELMELQEQQRAAENAEQQIPEENAKRQRIEEDSERQRAEENEEPQRAPENAGQQMNFNEFREEVRPNRIAEARLQPHDEVPHQVSAEAHRNIDLT